MVFIAFFQIGLSLHTGHEIDVFPMILYFCGVGLWAYSTVRNIAIRNTIVVISITCALAFFHFGEVLFWHKYLIFAGSCVGFLILMYGNPVKSSGDR